MKVVVAGERPFVEGIGRLCSQAGHDVVLYLVEDFNTAVQSGWAMADAANADIAIELHNESAAAKEELLVSLAASIPRDALLLTSAMATSTTQAAAWVPRPERVVGFGVVPPLQRVYCPDGVRPDRLGFVYPGRRRHPDLFHPPDPDCVFCPPPRRRSLSDSMADCQGHPQRRCWVMARAQHVRSRHDACG